SSVAKRIHIFLAYLFFLSIILLAARTATAVAYFSIVLFSLLVIIRNESRMKHFVNVALFIASMLFIHWLTLTYNNRFAQVKETVLAEANKSQPTRDSDTAQVSDNSTTIHFHLWKYSLRLIEKNMMFGVGTGDVKDELLN